jgi:cobalt-zinc-cadmium efflux system protein
MGHAHAHGPGHLHLHGNGDSPASRRRLTIALALILGLMAAEVVAGLLASSLALLSDAGHMLTDAAALALAIVAARLAARPPAGPMTYGLGRVEALSAMANGVTLALLGLWFIGTGIARLVDPPEVEGALVLVVALAGIAVNLAATWVLTGARTGSLNVEGAFQHVLTDLYAFIATALAAVAILLFDFDRADPLAALLVAALMLRAAVGLVRAAGRVVLEGSPEGLVPEQIGRALAARPHVVEVHDLHVWELQSGFPALSAHVTVAADCDCHAVRNELALLLHDRFGIDHATLQVDHERPSPLLRIEVET